MTAFTIKLIAIAAMLIDHIGYAFFPESFAFRAIGRLAFPLFAWLVANGALHTHNSKHYAMRLFAFALISQWPYTLLFHTPGTPYPLNIFFTLTAGLLSIILLKRSYHPSLITAGIISIGILAELSLMSYGFMGVISIVSFYVFFRRPAAMFVSQIFLNGVVFFIPFVIKLLSNPQTTYSISNSYLAQPLAVLAMPIVYMYNHKEGPKLQYLFYIFYPLHILIIWIIRMNVI